MAVPTRKKSKTRSKIQRSANIKYKVFLYDFCNNCNHATLPYCICKICGYYKSKKVINKKEKRLKKR